MAQLNCILFNHMVFLLVFRILLHTFSTYLFILFYYSFSIRDKTGEALKLLLSQGFDPNVQDRDKRFSPLHLAVHNSNEMAVRILTQYAACDVNLQVCVIGVASLESLNCAASSCQFYSYLNVFWLANSVQILDSYKVCSFHFYILLKCYWVFLSFYTPRLHKL